MLLGIRPSLPGELLGIMAQMGHGDELIVVDANYPAMSDAQSTVVGHSIEMLGHTAAEAIDDILSVLPLDAFADNAVHAMTPGDPTRVPDVHAEVNTLISQAPGGPWHMAHVDRFDFYDRARKAYVIVRTLERRPFGCFVLVKGVLTPNGDVMTPEIAKQL